MVNKDFFQKLFSAISMVGRVKINILAMSP